MVRPVALYQVRHFLNIHQDLYSRGKHFNLIFTLII
jgi:hypothetical protein